LLGRPIGMLEGLLNLRIDLPITPYGQRIALRRKLDTYINDLIDRRLVARSDVGDILSILLSAQNKDDGEGMPRQQVRDELVALTAAGHETTTNSMAWTFYLLSEHPAILKRVLGELETVLAGRDPRADDLPRLTYLDWVVKESMRLYPSAWTQGRQAVEAFDLDGYHFPAGTRVMFSQWVLHRLPDVWGDPEIFRPERWDPLHGQKVPQWTYFPFGGGSRICMGMPLAQLQIRLVLATILQHYIPRRVPRHPVVPLPLITLRLKHGLRMRLEPTPSAAVEAPADVGMKT
jgi:cytochrome P450